MFKLKAPGGRQLGGADRIHDVWDLLVGFVNCVFSCAEGERHLTWHMDNHTRTLVQHRRILDLSRSEIFLKSISHG